MFWTKLLHFLKIAWLFIKKYWALFLFIILTIISFILFINKNKQVKNLLKLLLEQSEKHHKDLSELQRIYEAEQKRRDEIQKQYDILIAKINQQHAEAIINLNRQKQEEIKKLIQQFQDDPDRMAKEINILLGIPIQNIPS